MPQRMRGREDIGMEEGNGGLRPCRRPCCARARRGKDEGACYLRWLTVLRGGSKCFQSRRNAASSDQSGPRFARLELNLGDMYFQATYIVTHELRSNQHRHSNGEGRLLTARIPHMIPSVAASAGIESRRLIDLIAAELCIRLTLSSFGLPR